MKLSEAATSGELLLLKPSESVMVLSIRTGITPFSSEKE